MAYANGQIPLSALTALSTGGHMLAPAAAAFEQWRIAAAKAGFDMRPTTVGDAYRNLARQINVFSQRYEPRAYPYVGPYKDVRYWKGVRYVRMRGAAAAVPGTSNHGKGLAVDIKNAGPFGGAYHAWMSRTGPKLGFTNTEGRSVNEPWHWVHSGAWTVNNPIGGNGAIITNPTVPNLPDPLESYLMSAEAVERLTRIEKIVTENQRRIDATPSKVWSATTGRGENERTMTEALVQTPERTAAAVWNTSINRGGRSVAAIQELADVRTAQITAEARVAGLEAALKALAEAKGFNHDAVLQVVTEGAAAGARQALESGVKVEISVPKEK